MLHYMYRVLALVCVQDGSWRVGEGVFCLLTPTHVYIARLKPSSNDVTMLFSIPQPAPGPQAAVPVTAWLPHNRKPTSAGFKVHVGSSGGSSSPSSSGGGTMIVPVAVLALGWGSRLVMFEVPLIGDHVVLAAALGEVQVVILLCTEVVEILVEPAPLLVW